MKYMRISNKGKYTCISSTKRLLVKAAIEAVHADKMSCSAWEKHGKLSTKTKTLLE